MVAKKIANRKINKFLCITVILLLGACFIVSPACAELDIVIDPIKLVVEEKFDKSDDVNIIVTDVTLTPIEKNRKQAELFGWSADLENIVSKRSFIMAEINKEFEEIRYTQEELDKINAYYTTYAINYKGSYSHASDVS